MREKSSKWMRRTIGALLFVLIAGAMYFSMPLLTALAVNSFYLAFFGFLAIAIGFLIYYLLK